MGSVRLTMLNSMAGREFAASLDQHVAWDLELLDLKECIFDKILIDLTDEEAERAAGMIAERGLSVYCLSTVLFGSEVEVGEEAFRQQHLGKVDRAIELGRIFKPHFVRLLGAQAPSTPAGMRNIDHIKACYPWLIPQYQEAIDRIVNAGFAATIENETDHCMLASVEDILGFFNALDRQETVCFTWDVQNLWQLGTFPTLDVYRQIKHLIGYYHMKGGEATPGSRQLHWATSLDDASWPVESITRAVINDGVSPVICLNGSHGVAKPRYDYDTVTKRDLDYMRHTFAGRVV